jgi:hypothetical protein
MEKWILKALSDAQRPFSDGFYTGKSYVHQKAKYAIVNGDKDLAKTYSTYPKAMAACRVLSFENYSFEVKRYSES